MPGTPSASAPQCNDANELTQGWVRLSECIAHDLKSPLISIRGASQSIAALLPDLLESYQLAVTHGLKQPIKNETRLKFIQEKALPVIDNDTSNAMKLNQSMMTYVHALMTSPQEMPSLSINECLKDALQSYSFQGEEGRALIHVDFEQDFIFKGLTLFMHDLLSNLLDNALTAIREAQKGEITIWVSKDDHWNTLHFKDTALGIDLKHTTVFDRFSSKRNGELKAGLGFCKQFIMLCGGEIKCNSVQGEFTEFIIKFPSIEDN